MEGHRFFDLVRWGVADVTLNAYSAYEKAQKKAYIYYNGPTFTKGKSEYFAIPQSEIDKLNADGQTHLKQNPGYSVFTGCLSYICFLEQEPVATASSFR